MKILELLTNAISWFKTNYKNTKSIDEYYFQVEEYMERKLYEVCKKLNECSYTKTELIQDIVENYEKEARKWKPTKRYDKIKFTAADYSSDEEESLLSKDNKKTDLLNNFDKL